MGRRRSELQDVIAAYITSKGVFPRPVQPKEVAMQIYNKEKHGDWRKFYQKIRRAMHRMAHSKPDAKCKRLKVHLHGYYGSYYNLQDVLRAEDPELTIHGLVLEGKISTEKNNSVLMTLLGTPFGTQSEEHRTDPDPSNGGWTRSSSYEGRKVTITLYRTGTILIRIRSSKYPMTPSEFSGFNGWLNGLFNNEVPLMNLYVIEVGVGKDFRVLRLDGIKSIKWGVFTNAYWELYQKNEEVMRMALHLNFPKNEISLLDAINLLQAATGEQMNLVDTRNQKDVIRPPGYQ